MGTNSKEYMRAWRLAHPDKMREYDQKWRAANPEIAKESDRRKYQKHNRKRYDTNPIYRAGVIARVAKWQKDNPERTADNRRDICNRRRARKHATQAGRVSYKQLLADSKGFCGICKQPMWGEPIEFDHILPIAKGGPHTQENMQAAHKVCNRRKSARVD